MRAVALAELSTEERGAAVAAVMALGAGAVDLLMRVSLRASEAAAALMELPREERAAVLAREVARANTPVPANLSLVHRDWIEVELVGETRAVRDAVAGGGEIDDRGRRWIQRRVLGGLVDMPGDDAHPVAALARAEVPALLDALVEFGREALAAALAGASRGEVAAVAARLGEPHGSALVRDVAAAVRRGVDDPLTRALARRAAGGARGPSERALVTTGVRRLAHAIAGAPGDAPRQLAQRLPRDLGLALIAAVATARDEQPGRELDEPELDAFAARLADKVVS